MDLKRRDEIVTMLRQAGAANDDPAAQQVTIHNVNVTLKLDGRALAALLRSLQLKAPKK